MRRFGSLRSTPVLLPVCSVIALLALCCAEMAVQRDAPSAWVAYAAGALVLGLGVLHGLLWELVLGTSVRLRPRVRLAVWLLIALGVGALQARDLNAFGHLSGRYARQAIAVLCLTFGGNVLLALIAYGMHRDAAGFLRAASWKLHALAVVLLCGLAGGLFWGDRIAYAGLYPQAHFALRLAAWILLTLGLGLALRRFDPRCHVLVLVPLLVAPMAPQLLRKPGLTFDALFTDVWTGFVAQLARRASDTDLDGYSSLFDGGDCRPWNPAVHPGAREIPGNGVDDNCILGDAPARAALPAPPPLPGKPSPLDVVLITCDALRPDHLGVYNRAFRRKGRGTSPSLDAFAEDAVVFERAYSAGGGTSVALAAMLRGVFPRRLRWTRYYETTRYRLVRKHTVLSPHERISSMFPLAYDDPRLSIASLLERRGMFTIAALDDGYSDMLRRGTGIETGFSAFLPTDDMPLQERDDAGTATNAIGALQFVPKGKRFFMWVHFFGTHGPNTFHPGGRVYGDTLGDGYDHEINYLDIQLGRLLAALEPRKHSTAVIIAADHGDVLENGRYHGYTVADDVARIPLIARVPGWPAARVRNVASLVDLLPTILDLTGTPPPTYLDGVSLRTQRETRSPTPSRYLFTDSWLFSAQDQPRVDITSVEDGTGKVVLDLLTQVRGEEYALPKSRAALINARLEQAQEAYLEEAGGTIHLQD